MKEGVKKALDKGLDSKVIADKLSIVYLLSTKMQEQSDELCDYLKQYGLLNQYRNDVKFLNDRYDNLAKKLMPLISEDGKKNLFEDYEKFGKIVDNFMKVEK